jgi:hypothetical protein
MKQSEVKRSEVVYIQGRGSSDYVATSYTLNGPGSFPGSILVFSSVFSCIFCVFSVFYVSCVLQCSCTCTVLMYMYCIVLRTFMYFVFVNTATGHKPNCS